MEDNMDGKAHAHGSEKVGLSIADCDRHASASLRCVDGVACLIWVHRPSGEVVGGVSNDDEVAMKLRANGDDGRQLR